MTLAPLLSALQFTIPYRVVGWLGAAPIVTVAVGAFFAHTIDAWGPWSPLHLLPVAALAMLARATIAARQGNNRRHRAAMGTMFVLCLVLPAALAFMPGRLLGTVLARTAPGYEQDSVSDADRGQGAR